MRSTLETLCGQAFGAGQLDMLGIYMQRSLVILNSIAVVLLYVFTSHILKLIGQEYHQCGRNVGAMDDPPALRLRHELPHHQVHAGLE
ncbi:hypothetical protein SAY86_031691 [Trapa natans]|uniref:Uncharacterized protein n=1 Tax=Trapa natans TaxID=22666 RepID=A0AAN7LM97_TRANT|nr:hypothetical protein SAY86_031691 [Trapa natans]